MSKACTKCTLVKELTLFSPDKRAKDGRQATCKACDAAKKALLLQDPEYKRKFLVRQSERHAIRMQDPEYRRKEADKKLAAHNRRMQDPEYAAKYRAQQREYDAGHRADCNAKARTSQIKALGHPNQARPAWIDLEFADLFFSEAYRLAECRKEITGFDWHVDHVIPLKGELVSGLHVPNNIQVIPAVMNVRKHNSFAVA